MALTVVIGPPAAGKTTYVLAHARPGDIVVDLDRLANALTCGGTDSHRHIRAAAAAVLGLLGTGATGLLDVDPKAAASVAGWPLWCRC